MRKMVCCAVLLLVLGLGLPVFGYGPLVEVAVQSDQEGILPLFPVSAENPRTYRAYVEAVRGARYGIRVDNRSPYRVGLVIAVDGRNIISGEKSFLNPRERMYILEPFATGYYEGWRTDRDRIQRFYFTQAADSYAGSWGDHSAMGVIALAVFPERRPPESAPPLFEGQGPFHRQDRKDGLNQAPSQPMRPRADARPGTGFGEAQFAPSVRVAFVPEAWPVESHFLKYEWRESLCRRGVIDCRPHGNRFWGDSRGFAPYPPVRHN